MKNKTIAKRYAQALHEIAQERNALDLFEKELNDLLASINSDQHLNHLWYSEKILTDDKKAAIKELFSQKLSEIIINFLRVLIDKNREAFLPDIFQEYKNLADASRNIIYAQVRTAAELTSKDYDALQKKLSVMTGKNVRLDVKVDPSLLGGLGVKIGDKVIDGSAIKRLAILKKNLKSIQFSKLGVRD